MTLLRLIACPALLILAGTAYAGSVPHPELDGLETAVAEQVREMRAGVERSEEADPAATAMRYAELGALYHSLNFLEAALACYEEAESLAPGEGRWPYLQGVLHTDRGALDKARLALLRALALQPDLSTGWVRLGRLAMQQGDERRALRHFRRALAKLPESATALAGAGQALLELDRPREAVDHLAKALEIEPRANLLHYPLAMAYRALGDEDKMQAHLEQVGTVGVTPDDPIAAYANRRAAGARVHIQQGTKAYRAGEYASAAASYTRATRAAPNKAPAWINLGAAQASLGDMDQARRSFERALAIEPDNTTALANLVSLLVSEGEEDAALPLLNEHLDLDTNNRELLHRRAELRRLNGDSTGAANDYKRLTALAPGETSAWLGLIIARIEAGEHQQVPELLAAAGEALDNPEKLQGELIDVLVTTHDGDSADAAVARRLAERLYDEDPRAAHAMRVVKTLLLGQTECTAARRWLDRRIDDDAVTESLRAELARIRQKLTGLERCAGSQSSGPDD